MVYALTPKSLKDVYQAQGALQMARLLGITSGEISYRDARDTYGKWFTDSVSNGRITPCRRGNGKTGARWFAIAEILALQEKDWGGPDINIGRGNLEIL